MRIPLTLFVFIFFAASVFAQRAFTASASLSAYRENYEFSYPFGSPTDSRTVTWKFRSMWFPVPEFSYQKFNEKGGFHQAGLYGLKFRLDDELEIIEEKSTGLEEPSGGVRQLEISVGLRYQRGWRLNRMSGEKWTFFMAGFAGLRYRHLYTLPKTSQGYPTYLNAGRLEAGLRLLSRRKLGEQTFFTVGLPVGLLENGFDIFQVRNPTLTVGQQRQTVYRQSYRFWERLGLEAGLGFFFEKK